MTNAEYENLIPSDLTQEGASHETLLAESTSEERFRRIAANMRDLVSEVDNCGAYTYASPSYKTVLGYDPNDLIGKTAFEHVHPDDVHATLIAFDKTIKSHSPGQAQFRVRKANGEYIWLETTGNAVLDDTGTAIGAVFCSRDVNARVLAEKQLEAGHTLLQRILESTSDEVFSLDTNGCYTSFNTKHAAMMQQLNGATIQIGGNFLRYPANTEALNNIRMSIEKALQGQQCATSFSRGNGASILYYEVSLHPILHESKTISGVAVFMQDITQRKKTEEALRYNEELYRSLFMNMLNGFAYCKMVFDQNTPLDFIYLNVNSAFETLTGLKNVTGKKVSEVIPGIRESDPKLLEIFGRVALTGVPERFENYVQALGMSFSISVYSPGKDYFVAIFEVITEHERAEEAVRESEERFRMVFENVFDGISIYSEDPDPSKRRLVECNDRYAAMANRSREELLQRGSTQGFQITLDDKANNIRLESLVGGTAYGGSFSWIRPDGKENVIEYVGMPITWRGKSYSIGIDRDITERKQSERALRRSEEHFSQAFELAPIGMALVSLDGRWLKVNSSVCELVGYSAAELLAMTFQDITHPDDLQGDLELLHQLMAGDIRFYQIEKRYFHKCGHIVQALLNVSCVRDEQGQPLHFISQIQDITERKKAEETLSAERNFLRTVIDNLPDRIYVKDFQSRFLLNNIAHMRALGAKTLDELIGKTDFDFRPYDLAEKYRKDDRIVIESGMPLCGKEQQSLSSTGEDCWLLSTKVPVRDSQNAVIGLVGISTDITQRKKVEEALLESKEFLDKIINSISDPIFVKDREHRLILVNDAFCALAGAARNDLIGKTDRDFFPEEQVDVFWEIDEMVYETGTENINEEQVTDALGNITTIITKKCPYTDKAGQKFIVGIIRDITKRKEKEDALRTSEERLRLISENVADMITLLDEDGVCLFASRSYRNFGHDPEKLIGQCLFDFIHPDDVIRVKNEFHLVTDAFETRSMEYRFQRKDGTWRFVESAVSLLINDAGVRLVAVARDITDRVQREEERQSLEKELVDRNLELEQMVVNMKQMQSSLIQSEKMASVGLLTAGIAHEINNPLAFVSSNLNRFKEYFEDTLSLLEAWKNLGATASSESSFTKGLDTLHAMEQQIDLDFVKKDFATLMQHAREGTNRIRTIVEQLRGFSHISDAGNEEASINKALDDTVSFAWNEIKYKAEVQKEYGDIPLLACNIGELQQVFVNLVINGAHAINTKGVITLRTSVRDHTIVIEISDTGCGIPQENLSRIFDPFFTTKAVGKGTGLGLWISASIIKKHGGTITVASTVGVGTMFSISFPLPPASSPKNDALNEASRYIQEHLTDKEST